MKLTFRTIGIGCKFYCNGNLYTKRSTRTAVMEGMNRTFYFGQLESCVVEA